MSKNLILSAVVVLALCAGVIATRVTAQTEIGPSAVGRFQMLTTPPVGPTGGPTYTNFMWVLDTQTGVVTGYRVANAVDRKEVSTFTVERLPSANTQPR